MNNLELAIKLHEKGINTLPIGEQKMPAVKTWKDLQKPIEKQILVNLWNSATRTDRIAIAGGKVKCLDIDLKIFKEKGERTEYKKKILNVFEKAGLDEIRQKCLLQETQSYGLHLVWTSDSTLGNEKIALINVDGKWKAIIETRGHGGYFLIEPSAGYEVKRGSFDNLCHLTIDEENLILDACRSLCEKPKQVICDRSPKQSIGLKPGDDFNRRANVEGLLVSHGWSNPFADKWRRPGKANGISASLGHCKNEDGTPLFYVFSSNAEPFESEKSYSPFAVYAMLEHNGDFTEAAKALGQQGYGETLAEKKRNEKEFEVKNSQTIDNQNDIVLTDKKEKEINFPQMISLCDFPHDLEEQIKTNYPVIVDGLIHAKTKVVLGGGSKSFKSWCLMDLCLSVANGGTWFGRKCEQMGTLYINMELKDLFGMKRIKKVEKEKLYLQEIDGTGSALFKIWNLRGVCYDLAIIAQQIKKTLEHFKPGLIVIDPIYKCLGDRDENASRDMNALMDLIEKLIEASGAAVVFGAHFSKGNQSGKEAIDRISGSGVFGRDPDTILPMTKHEDENCFVIEPILRNFPPMDSFVIEWCSPVFRLVNKDPKKLKKNTQGNTVDPSALLFGLKGIMTLKEWQDSCENLKICSRNTFKNKYLSLISSKKVREISNGVFCA